MRAVLLERLLLLLAVIVFFLLQLRLFGTQTDCSRRITKAEESQRSTFSSSLLKVKQDYAAAMGRNRELEKRIEELEVSLEAVLARENSAKVELARLRRQEDRPDAREATRNHNDVVGDEGRMLVKKQAHRDSIEEREDDKWEEVTEGASKRGDHNVPAHEEVLPTLVKAPVLAKPTSEEAVAAVVVMTCNRPDYLKRSIDSILSVPRDPRKFPLYISQDGRHGQVQQVAQKAAPNFQYIQHIERKPPTMRSPSENMAYYRIAEHYKFAFSQFFDTLKYKRVIVLEDDMELAPDFFDFFEAMAALLDEDSSLMAVSSWNDNGQKQFALDSTAVLRSDFFPGLGWMLKRSLWEELGPKWPRAYWDDWMRERSVRKGRQTLHPEVCRTYNFGEVGSSNGQFFGKYLEPIRLNKEMVNWKGMDLSYLLPEEYNKALAELIMAAKALPSGATSADVEAANARSVIVNYKDEGNFQAVARSFGIFEEWKDGVPRTAYKGVVVFWYRRTRVFLIPSTLDIAALKSSKS